MKKKEGRKEGHDEKRTKNEGRKDTMKKKGRKE
jgi:hypothetical protein